MPTFEIEQYEIHTQRYRVEAANDAEAIKKLFAREADALDNEQEYIEVAEDLGLPVDDYRELASALRTLGVAVGPDVIPSIRSVEIVDDEPVASLDCARCGRTIDNDDDEESTPSGSMHRQCAAEYESESPQDW